MAEPLDEIKATVASLEKRFDDAIEAAKVALKTDTTALQHQLTRLTTAKTSVNTITWQVFTLFNAAMGVLANAAVNTNTNWVRGYVVCAIGFLAANLWRPMQNRMLGHLKIHEHAIQTVEKELRVELEHSVNQPKDGSGATETTAATILKDASKYRARDLMRTWIIGVTIAWAITVLGYNGPIQWWIRRKLNLG